MGCGVSGVGRGLRLLLCEAGAYLKVGCEGSVKLCMPRFDAVCGTGCGLRRRKSGMGRPYKGRPPRTQPVCQQRVLFLHLRLEVMKLALHVCRSLGARQ